MSIKHLRDLLLGAFFVILQVVIVRHLSFGLINADIIWAYVLWLIVSGSRTKVILLTAGISMFQDALMDSWGVHLFSKTLTVFLIYNFVPKLEENRFTLSQVFFFFIVSSIILHTFGYATTLFTDTTQLAVPFYVFVLGKSFFTSIFGCFVYLLMKDSIMNS